MPRLAVATTVAVSLAAAGTVALVAATDDRRLAFLLPVNAEGITAVARPGGEVCQRDIDVEARFEVVEFTLGTYGRPGPRLAVTVRDMATGRQLAAGALPEGAVDNRSASARVAPAVRSEARVEVCARNIGRRRVAFYGDSGKDPVASAAFVGDRPVVGDIRLVFFRGEPRSALSLIPEMMERAALFRPGPIGAPLFWILLAGIVVGLPALLGAALVKAGADAPNPPSDWHNRAP
jgi:hypothetical protein